MSAYLVYDVASGEILRSGTAPAAQHALQAIEPGEAVLSEAGDDASEYVDLATLGVTARQAMTPATTITTGQVEITGLPLPCTIAWEGQEAEVTDGIATIDFDEPGDYALTIRARPQYLDHTLELTIP